MKAKLCGAGSKGGFTLIELLLAVFFFAIVTAIAVPAFRGYIDNTNLKGAARQLISDIGEIQQKAKAENRPYTITYRPDPTNTYRIQAAAANGLSAVDETKTLVGYGGAMRITATTFLSNDAKFQSRGLLEQGGTITLRNGRNSTATINTTIAGRANVTFILQ